MSVETEMIHVRVKKEFARQLRRLAKQNEVSNKAFAEEDLDFLNACKIAGVAPNARQASKWRRKEGKAWQVANWTPTSRNIKG